MQYRPKNRLTPILSAIAAVCLVGCGGCKQQPENVPTLNKESAARAEAQAKADAKAKAEADAAKAKAEADAKAAEEAARAAAEAKAAEEAAKAAAEAKAAEEAAKAAADAKAAEEAAKAQAEAKAAAEAEAAKQKAAEEAAAAAKAAEEAKAAADAEAAKQKAAQEAATKAKAEAEAPKPPAPAPIAEDKIDFKPTAEGAPAVAKDLATQLAAFEIPNTYGAKHGRLVVQINRVRNDSEIPLENTAVTNAMRDALGANAKLVAADKLYGASSSGPVKAIHLAFDRESRALGLMPTSKLSDAPDVIVSTSVARVGQELRLTLVAKETAKGQIIWKATKPITSASVVVTPAAPVTEPAPAPAPTGEAPASEPAPAPAAPEAPAQPAPEEPAK